MGKRKTTIYIDEDVLRASKIAAARTDKRESEIIEDALRDYLGLSLMQRLWNKATTPEDVALKDAAGEARIVRRQMQAEQ